MSTRDPDRCSAPYRVRFDEGGPDGLIRTSVLLRYTQDLAGHHSTMRGYGRQWYAERAITWLVRAAEVGVVAQIGVGDELTGTTEVVGWRRVWARRRTEFRDPAGALAAWVHIDWVLVDARGAPTRIPAEFDAVFGAPAATFGLARVGLGTVPPDADRRTFAVRPQELDPMEHVNNAVYADWLDEAILDAGGAGHLDGAPGSGDPGVAAVRAIPRLARLEYARAAEPSATLVTETWRDGPAWSCRLGDEHGDLLRARMEPLADQRRALASDSVLTGK